MKITETLPSIYLLIKALPTVLPDLLRQLVGRVPPIAKLPPSSQGTQDTTRPEGSQKATTVVE